MCPITNTALPGPELGEKVPAARTANPKDFVDTRILEEFDRSGFIDGLYKQQFRVIGPRTQGASAVRIMQHATIFYL